MGLTYILVKPEAIKHVEEIKRDILNSGFEIIKEKEIDFEYYLIRQLYSPERLNYPTEWDNRIMSIFIPNIYSANFGSCRFLKAHAFLLSYKNDAIKKLVEVTGPTDAKEYKKPKNAETLRGRYGLGPEYNIKITIDNDERKDADECEWCFNAIHRPSKEEELDRGLKILFPDLSF